VINYLGAFILFPLLLTISSGTTLFLSTLSNTYLGELGIISALTTQILGLLPYVLVTLGFVCLYFFVPNVRVHFIPALIAGLIAGIAFQIFQALYINGVLWISRYNAIYGSFAAVPLALLWIQLSWIIILLGAQISYSIQHVWHFTSPPNSRPLSRRYADTVFIALVARITARYTSEDPEPYRAETLAAACDLPLRQTQEALSQLTRMGVLIEVNYGKDEVMGGYYCPNIAPDRLTLGVLLDHIDRFGGELLSLKLNGVHAAAWQARTRAYAAVRERADVLLRDLV